MFTRISATIIVTLTMALVLAPTGFAQTNTPVPGTITVIGEGSASAPAEEASIVISIGPDSNVYYEEPLPMEESTIEPTEAINATPVVEAIIAFGIPESDVHLVESPFMGEWGTGMGPQPATILVTVAQPTVEDLSDLLEAVRGSAHGEGLFVNQFGVMYSVADCRTLRQEARANAIMNARAEADDQAAALNVSYGDVVASRDTYPINPGYFPTNSCNTSISATPYSAIYMAGQFDPGLPAEVTVWMAVEVSFEIP